MVRYRAHCLMEEVQSFHLISIAPTAARVTENIMTMQYMSTLLTISMAVAVRRYYTARITWWVRSMAFIKATKHRQRASTCSDIIKRDIAMQWICYLFRVSGAGDGAIYASIWCVLADGPKPKKTHKKYDENIGRHLKKKKIGTPKVFQRIRYSPLRSKKSQPNLSRFLLMSPQWMILGVLLHKIPNKSYCRPLLITLICSTKLRAIV